MHELPLSYCLCCNKRLDGASAVTDDGNPRPEPGNFTICVYCSHLMVFDADLKVRQPTDEEIREAAGDPDLVRAMRVTGRIRAENEGGYTRSEGDY